MLNSIGHIKLIALKFLLDHPLGEEKTHTS